MAQWYGLTQEEVLKRLGTNRTGLNEKEAERRLETYGENVLKEQEEMPWWQVFLGQFKDLLVMILIGAAGVSMVTGDPESALVIFSVLLLNAILGTVEHQKARKSLESLKRLASPETLLIREGRVCTAPSSRVVPGDILVLETGGMVPADGRILQSCSLTCNESSLTGEALNVEKREGKLPAGKTPLSPGDQSNMVFSGALITGGRGTAVVTETGMDLSDQPVSQGACIRCPDVCGSAGGCSHPGGSWLHCDHCPGNGNPENGKRACSHKGPESSGKFRLCICDLF